MWCSGTLWWILFSLYTWIWKQRIPSWLLKTRKINLVGYFLVWFSLEPFGQKRALLSHRCWSSCFHARVKGGLPVYVSGNNVFHHNTKSQSREKLGLTFRKTRMFQNVFIWRFVTKKKKKNDGNPPHTFAYFVFLSVFPLIYLKDAVSSALLPLHFSRWSGQALKWIVGGVSTPGTLLPEADEVKCCCACLNGLQGCKEKPADKITVLLFPQQAKQIQNRSFMSHRQQRCTTNVHLTGSTAPL